MEDTARTASMEVSEATVVMTATSTPAQPAITETGESAGEQE
jgi:hypothetical protein